MSERLDKMGVTSALVTTDQVVVGLDLGEWEGGLRRIDRRTGKLTVLESNASGELCGGPLNTRCDPINGIAIAPWKPGPILVVTSVNRRLSISGDVPMLVPADRVVLLSTSDAAPPPAKTTEPPA